MSLNSICYEQISENFYYGLFGDFQLVIDKTTGCFNGTKLCAMAKKSFFNWKKTFARCLSKTPPSPNENSSRP
jgi:hypothetical protein